MLKEKIGDIATVTSRVSQIVMGPAWFLIGEYVGRKLDAAGL